MSAFMVSKSHIDAIVATALHGPTGVYRSEWGCNPPFPDANAVGEMLVKENLSSIHARYPDTLTNPEATPGPIDQYWLREYRFTEPAHALQAIAAIKLLDCYEYQSCEHKEWETSDARKFCDHLRRKLVTYVPGYDEAAWEFDLRLIGHP